jgi:AcrR family transcriptional regulator
MRDLEPLHPPASLGRRAHKKASLRTRICDELIKLLAEGTDINHDVVATRAKVSRRTVYRYFPDRESLLEATWAHVATHAGAAVHLPRSEADLINNFEMYAAFDRNAPIITLVASTPQGRAMRLASRKRRVRSYTAAMAQAVKDLPREDQKLATAVVQLLSALAWLEMRDQWGLNGAQIARATRWAICTLLDDLRARKGAPLDATPRVNAAPRAKGGRST